MSSQNHLHPSQPNRLQQPHGDDANGHALARPRTGLNRRHVLLSALGLTGASGLVTLAGCGGGDDTNEAYLRFVNASVDFPSADLWLKGIKSIAALANAGGISSWSTLTPSSVQIDLHAVGNTTSVLTETRTLAADSYTSVIVYGSLATSMKYKYLDEANAAPASGYTRVRLFQGASTLSGLDVYVTNTTSLSGLAPTLSVSALGETTDFVTLATGTYRIRATAKGDQGTVLFDHTVGVSFSSQSVVTLVMVPRTSGSLPNISVLAEQSNGVVLANALAS